MSALCTLFYICICILCFGVGLLYFFECFSYSLKLLSALKNFENNVGVVAFCYNMIPLDAHRKLYTCQPNGYR